MDLDVWLRLIVFAAAGFITPGPNTMMVLASGVNFGFQRTIPHILGVMAGTFFLFLAVGLGLNAILLLYPSLKIAIQIVGALYLLYLAGKIATAAGLSAGSSSRPISFFQAVGIQALNVKLMGLAASVSVNYPILADPYWNVLAVGLTAALVNGPCISAWGQFGVHMRTFLGNRMILRSFNVVLALLIILTLIPIINDIVVSFETG